MSINTKFVLLSSLCLLQQGCDRDQHQATEPLDRSELHAPMDATHHTLLINDSERYALTGNLDHLVISYQIYHLNQWVDQCSCLVERLNDDGRIHVIDQNSHQEGAICHYDSQGGEVGYHAATFYHGASGLLIHQMRCDHPGMLNARATLHGGKVIARTEMQTSDGKMSAGALFIPFEAEVAAEGNSLLIRGEGELILVMAIDANAIPHTSVAEKWRQACIKHDPSSNEHYDVIKVTKALRSECESPARNP